MSDQVHDYVSEVRRMAGVGGEDVDSGVEQVEALLSRTEVVPRIIGRSGVIHSGVAYFVGLLPGYKHQSLFKIGGDGRVVVVARIDDEEEAREFLDWLLDMGYEIDAGDEWAGA